MSSSTNSGCRLHVVFFPACFLGELRFGASSFGAAFLAAGLGFDLQGSVFGSILLGSGFLVSIFLGSVFFGSVLPGRWFFVKFVTRVRSLWQAAETNYYCKWQCQ